MSIINPFIYGKPVSGDQHINREEEIRTIFSRLINGECTAIVGEPRMGKTSLLRRLASDTSQKKWLNQQAASLIVIELDFYQEWLDVSKTPKDFWKNVLDNIKIQISDETIRRQISLVEDNEYGSATLASFFQNLGRKNLRVVLLIDEFDAILTHPNFSTAEFLGGLRSLAMRDGFQIITASIMSVEEMNLRFENSNPLGSPFFNHFIEINLKPFGYKDVGVLIDAALQGSGVEFDRADRNFVVWISGRHPYRVQVACATLFDGIKKGLEGKKRYLQAAEWFTERTNDHFSTMWRRYLSETDRTVLVILSLVELGGMVHNRKFSFGEIERPQYFAPELKRLEKMGLVEKINTNGLQWDQEHLLLWQGGRWRISSSGFVDWLANNIISGSRGIPDFKKWLHNKEKIGNILTRNQIDFLEEVKNNIPKNVMNGVTLLADKFISEILLSK